VYLAGTLIYLPGTLMCLAGLLRTWQVEGFHVWNSTCQVDFRGVSTCQVDLLMYLAGNTSTWQVVRCTCQVHKQVYLAGRFSTCQVDKCVPSG
jgi:hypothetical protein